MSRADHIAFVCPRFPEGPAVGGAETLLRHLASIAVSAGRKVTFLTTCARNHFSWKNEIPEGKQVIAGIEALFFPVDTDRDISMFLKVQEKISRGAPVSPSEETAWFDNNVNSRLLIDHLRKTSSSYSRIIMGPYLFGLIFKAASVCPEKTFLVPCLHDEPFAALPSFKKMFNEVAGMMFNTAPEGDFARQLYGLHKSQLTVVGIGIDPFKADPNKFASSHGINARYLIYSGRREPMKGTPLLMDYLQAFRLRTGLDIKLVLTGSGHIDIPSGLSEHVIDAGVLPEKEMHDAMAGAVAFCHPSVYESLGIVLLESWMAETPVLVHAGSAVLQWQCKRSNGGLWFNNYPEFEEELLLLLNNETLRRKLANSGRQYVLTEYSRDIVKTRMLDFLDAQ